MMTLHTVQLAIYFMLHTVLYYVLDLTNTYVTLDMVKFYKSYFTIYIIYTKKNPFIKNFGI